ALILWPAACWWQGLYPGYGLTAPRELRKQVTASIHAGLLLAAGTIFFAPMLPLPKSLLILLVLFGMALLPIGRGLAKLFLVGFSLWGNSVVILGAGNTGKRIARILQGSPLIGFNPLGFFDDDSQKHGEYYYGLRVVGSLQDADRFAVRHDVTHAIVAIPSLPSESLSAMIEARGKIFRQVQFIPGFPGLLAEDVTASHLGDVLAIEVRKGLYLTRNRIMKRLVDILGSALGLLLLSPLLGVLYLWIRIDSRGPGFYWSERLGEGGEPFRCLKFRTMYVDADTRLRQMMQTDPGIKREYEHYHKLENDPRVTRAGRILRKYSLDEFSQLFNVLKGEMSLVGPRPYMTREREDIGEYGKIIFEAKPGMTGFWQVSARNEVTFQDRLEMETHYVRSWSVWWDIILFFQTFPAMLERRGS
ncbi:MAG: exopolysaccharide biosynthesis polyprenyl glycosylphosphotransferase, partial [Trueperaceae bacterium]